MIRAFQWDLARQVERLDWLLDQLPRYADWGYQELYLHLEDAVEYPRLPAVARPDAYSHRQMQRLVKAAGRVGIGVVPIVNLLGHTQYLIKVPALRDLNELRNPDGSPEARGQICPLHPRTLEVAARLIDDVQPFCTAGKLHVGLDESFLLGRHPDSRREIEQIGLAAHFAGHAGRLHGLVSARGLRMGLWADMLALLPAAIPLLPPGTIAYDWYYYPFRRHPRMELHNFAEYDLVPALRARGLDYWGCPMNGAFRFEPLPVFRDRLENLRSWWARCHRVQAEGFLVTSWEPYRLAIETTTLVDAAAASLWLDPDATDHTALLTAGLQRLWFGARSTPNTLQARTAPQPPSSSNRVHARVRSRARAKAILPPFDFRAWARTLLSADQYAYTGYARWEINQRWDGISTREPFARFAAEARFFARLARSARLTRASHRPASSARPGKRKSAAASPPLLLAMTASLEFRGYLARRDEFVRTAARGLWKLRRRQADAVVDSDPLSRSPAASSPTLRPSSSAPNQAALLRVLLASAHAFHGALADGLDAARRMWALTRDPATKGQNEALLALDGRRLSAWTKWLRQSQKNPQHVFTAASVGGAWQLQLLVHLHAPALQKLVVEAGDANGTWHELASRFTVEFRAEAARPRARIQRTWAVPIPDPSRPLRLVLRGLGTLAVSHLELTDGVTFLQPIGWPLVTRHTLGEAAPQAGFPVIDWTRHTAEILLNFPPRPQGKSHPTG